MLNRSLIIAAGLLMGGCNTAPFNQASLEEIETPVITEHTPDEAPPPVEILADTTDLPPATSTTKPAIETEPRLDNIWVRLRENLELNRHLDKRTVKERIAWYARHQDYLDRVAQRATPYIYHIVEELEKRDMPLDLALLPVVESAYHPFAYSRSHASGIWQFIPSTGRLYGLKQNWWYDGRRDIYAATRAALDYLEKLHDQFDGDWEHALASYNSGERNVERAIRRNRSANKDTDFFSLRLPRETRGYVPSLLAIAEIVAHPEKYDVSLTPIPNRPYFEKVDIGGQLDLATASELTGLSIEELYTLNPGFNRWATDPDGPHYLLIPLDKKDQFIEGLAAIPSEERVGWRQHVIKNGETLSGIAERYKTNVATIRESNNLRNNIIRAGNSLVIPTAKQPGRFYTLSLENRWLGGLKREGSGNKYIYTVRRGDSLWTIGRRYDVSINELSRWNGINPRGILRPGQKLTLWIQGSGDDSSVASSSSRNSENGDATTYYTVRKGDSLWLIARRHGVTISQIRAWNNLASGRYLQPGQKLALSGTVRVNYPKNENGHIQYTVRKGDSLWLIARRFGVTVAQLQEWNNLPRGKYLQPGQTLVLLSAPALGTEA